MNEDIRHLIFQAIDQTISTEDFERLQDAIETNEEIRREYLRAVRLCETLAEIPEAQVDQSTEPTALAAGSNNDLDDSVTPEASAYGSQGLKSSRFRSAVQHAAVALVAIVMTAVAFSTIQSWRPDDSQKFANVKADHDVVARVIQRIDCVMQDEKWSLANPNEFEAGQSVRLSEGLAILRFSRGAQVTLQGPAELEIVSDNSGFLRSGKLTATVPPESIGFEILTPNSRVIDHGTEFGVSVDDEGNSETHVFDGEVELLPANSRLASDQAGHRLSGKMAMRFAGESDVKSETMPAKPRGFIRIAKRAKQSVSQSDITALPHQRDLVLWLEGSQGVQLDGESRVVSWDNLAPEQSSSVSSSAAWQVNPDHRPYLDAPIATSDSGFPNHPTVRFGGYENPQFLVTTPLQLGDEITSFVVCHFSPTSSEGYGHVLTLGGQNRLILERRTPNMAGCFLRSWQSERTPQFKTTVLKTDKIAKLNDPTLFAIRYSQAARTCELFADGQLATHGEAIGSLAAFASQTIGCVEKQNRFFFEGNIAEIAIYNRMLDDDDFALANSAIMAKYKIVSGSQ